MIIKSNPLRYAVLSLLFIAGFVLSLMALDLHIAHIFQPGKSDSYCNISAQLNCDSVIKSNWSVFMGVPLAQIGLAFYAALFLMTLCVVVCRVSDNKKIANFYFFTALAATLDSIFLLLVSIFEIKTVCPVCAGVYLVNFLLALFTWKGDPNGTLFRNVLSGLLTCLSAPVKFFTVWKKGIASKFRAFSFLVPVAIMAGLIVADQMPHYRVADIRDSIVSSSLELPWPKDYQMPDTIQIDNGPWGDYYAGTAGAPITVVEFFDYQCPYCRHFYDELHEFIKNPKYKGKFLLVFKNYPLDKSCNKSMPGEAHKHACYSALISRCAGEQGRFHEVSDYILRADIFSKEAADSEVREKINKVISLFGLDKTELESCMESDRQLNHIKSDIELGNMLGLSGTPAIWINGKQVPDVSIAVLETIFDDILKDD